MWCMNYRSVNISALLLIIASAISISPLIPVIGKVNGNILSLISLIVFYIVKLNPLSRANIAFLLLTIGFISSLYSLIENGLSVAFLVDGLMIIIICLILDFLLRESPKTLFYGLLLLLSSILKKIKFPKKSVSGICVLVVLSAINAFYWGQPTFRVTIYFDSIFLILFLLEKSDISDFTDYMSKILILMLTGSVIGFFWAIGGGDAIFSIANEDGRENGFYLTTFSSTYLLGIIRPSGIFDEPGALSFFICITVALRERFGMNRKASWILMVLGLVTTSLAHVIFMVVYWVNTEWATFKRAIIGIVVVLAALFLLTTFENPIGTVLTLIFNRFQIVDGALAGDNRSILVMNALNYLDFKTFLFGLDSDCILNLEPCSSKSYEQYGENPLTLLVHWGILISLPYYLVLGYLIKDSIIEKNLLALGVFLLLLQRPNVMSYGYAVIIMIYVYSLTLKTKHEQSI